MGFAALAALGHWGPSVADVALAEVEAGDEGDQCASTVCVRDNVRVLPRARPVVVLKAERGARARLVMAVFDSRGV